MDGSTGGRVIGIVKQGIIGMFIYLHTKNVKEYRLHKTCWYKFTDIQIIV